MRFSHSFLGLCMISAAYATEGSEPIRVIVKYKQPPAAVKTVQGQIKQAMNLPVESVQPMAGGAYIISFYNDALKTAHTAKSEDSVSMILKRLKSDPNVVYAVKDRKGYFKPLPQNAVTEHEPRLSRDAQWDTFTPPGGVMLESAPGLYDGAWYFTTGFSTPPTIVAVLDTGIANHESLIENLVKDEAGNIWGWNFSANNSDLSDETGSYHGTHVSGTIASNSYSVKGMGEDLKVLTVKIPDASGMFYESAVVNAIRWAVGDHIPGVPDNPYPAKVLNMSFGVDERPGKEIDHCDEALQEAILVAREHGAVVVAAAGNDNRWEHFNAPAVCNGVVKVASTGPAGTRAYYSNYGPSVTFAAPGGDISSGNLEDGILSTVNPGGGYKSSGYNFYQGTSMASPHVAGIAGLIFSVSGGLYSPQEIEQLLYTTTHAFGETDDDKKSCLGRQPCGHGIVDAQNAVKAAIAHFDVLLSAPRKNVEGTQQLLPEPAHSYWVPVNSSLASDAKSLVDHIKQDKSGKIYAYSAGQAYELDQTAFSRCEVIGFDGIGCYK